MNEADIGSMSGEDKVRKIAELLELPARAEADWERLRRLWNPLTDANARDEVVNALLARGYIVFVFHGCPSPGRVAASVKIGVHDLYAEGDTAGEAVVNAALLAIGD